MQARQATHRVRHNTKRRVRGAKVGNKLRELVDVAVSVEVLEHLIVGEVRDGVRGVRSAVPVHEQELALTRPSLPTVWSRPLEHLGSDGQVGRRPVKVRVKVILGLHHRDRGRLRDRHERLAFLDVRIAQLQGELGTSELEPVLVQAQGQHYAPVALLRDNHSTDPCDRDKLAVLRAPDLRIGTVGFVLVGGCLHSNVQLDSLSVLAPCRRGRGSKRNGLLRHVESTHNRPNKLVTLGVDTTESHGELVLASLRGSNHPLVQARTG
mmetsp:Transcript_21425/g.50374  ORF Transcript_21425/g.50374 Transcript_21425/m.50374 type:complete len:266 (+) Transcript_21425:546-1343(+)